MGGGPTFGGPQTVERFVKIPPLDISTMLFVAKDACKENDEAVQALDELEKSPSPLFDMSISELETSTKLCLQDGLIPKEPYDECMRVRAKIFSIIVIYGSDDI